MSDIKDPTTAEVSYTASRVEVLQREASASAGSYQAVPPAIIAIAVGELNQWGCPYCGYRSGSTPIQMGGAAIWDCGECRKSCYILAEGLTEAPFGSEGSGYTLPMRGGELPATASRPKLSPHPRRGTPAHGRPDTRPPTGGEWFGSRGPGMDMVPTCFVCGVDTSAHYVTNTAAFVQCKEAGERVVAMFGKGARLDYRERYPDRVQVKIGACKAHAAHIERLHDLTREAGGTIDAQILEQARAELPPPAPVAA